MTIMEQGEGSDRAIERAVGYRRSQAWKPRRTAKTGQ